MSSSHVVETRLASTDCVLVLLIALDVGRSNVLGFRQFLHTVLQISRHNRLSVDFGAARRQAQYVGWIWPSGLAGRGLKCKSLRFRSLELRHI